MNLPDIFNKEVSNTLVERINKLTAESLPLWGKMNVSQMFAHCNVTYEMAYENIHAKPNFLMSLILKFFVKNKVVSSVPYKKSIPTAPQFVMKETKNFEEEKARLVAYINKTQELGSDYFENRENLSFGKLTAAEWNNMFYKHLDHHLCQFGV